MIRLVRGWRLLRVGRGRIIRVVMVVLLLVIAWQTLLSKNILKGLKESARTHPDAEGNSRSPNLQVVAPAKEPRSSAIPSSHQVAAPAQLHPSQEVKEIERHWKERENVLRGSNNINPRYNVRAMKDKLHDLHPKAIRNQHFLQQNQLNLINDVQEEEGEDDDDEYDEDEDEGAVEEGKWYGRNKEDNADNVAIEEEDDNANDDYEPEDVGGEKLKKSQGKENKKVKSKKNKSNEGELDDDEERMVEFKELLGERKKEEIDDDNQKRHVEEGRAQELAESEVDRDMEAIEKEMTVRRARVKKVCGKYGLGPLAPTGVKPVFKHPPTPNYEIFYISRDDKLAWCPIYKAASTSWLHNFLILGGLDEVYIKNAKEQISHMARRVWPPLEYEDAEQAFKTCLKFMVVRHPFERLVSAYRDKLENTNIGKEHGVEHFYQKYGRKIVAKYRLLGQGRPARRYSQDMDDPSIPAPKGIEPTFEEFVKYIIDTDLVYYADDHWMPYYLHCTPCLLDYDVIAKFETLERDQNYIIEKKHIGDKIKPSWKHLTKGKKTSDTIRKYFATITKKNLMDLYEKYRLDFELFGYSVGDYLEYVRES